MEKEIITFEVEAGIITANDTFKDFRRIKVEATRGEIANFLDKIIKQVQEKFGY